MALKGRFFRRVVIALAAVGVVGFGAGAFAACSNQGEGEYCDRFADNNGNDDCQDGLECTPFDSLNGQATARPTSEGGQSDAAPPADLTRVGRCCPPLAKRPNATTLICQLAPPPGGADAAPPPEAAAADVSVDAPSPDASGLDANVPDAGGEASTDAASDADSGG